jgi:multidrug efflux system outer membrane protein
MRAGFFFVFIIPLVMGACFQVGPKYHRPGIGTPVPDRFEQASAETSLPPPDGRWWEAFGNPELNRMVDDALKNNLDLRKTAARILELRAEVVRSRADRFPFLGFEGEIQKQRQTITVVGDESQIAGRHITTDSYSLTFPASFEVDLWGRLASEQDAAAFDLLEAEENRRTLAQTVVADTIALYLEMESLERRIQVTEQSIDNYRRSLKLVRRRYERGLAPILDLVQARRILAEAKSFLPSMRQELGITQQNLAVLLGRYPETHPARKLPDDYYKRMGPVPPGLPSGLLLRRPDIRAAENRLKALNSRVGAAKASRFPNITLTGSFGYSSDELDCLLRPESEWWNLALGLAQPLFDAGKLKAGQRAAEARYAEGVAEYAKTVLTAFAEVEGALLTRKEQLERRKRVVNFLNEARATQKVAQSRYERGLESYLEVLDAQQTRFQAEEDLVLVDLSIMTNRVTLHRALGGGWAKPPPVPAEKENKIFDAIPMLPMNQSPD